MPESKLLDDFQKNVKEDLLKALLEIHDSSPVTSQEEKVAILVSKLEEIFRGKINEDK
jgi:hypothetical protein